jgi:hypothetical protein
MVEKYNLSPVEALQRFEQHESAAIKAEYQRLGCTDIPVQRLTPSIDDVRALQMRCQRAACAESSMAVPLLDYLASNYSDPLVVLHYM